jgi:hypothetical protein
MIKEAIIMTTTKLATVRNALVADPNIVIVNVDERNYLPDRDGYFSHTVDYWIAPKGGLYTAKKLQRFMMSLVQGLKPTMIDDFRESPGRLSYGKLYFDEKIGEERTITERIFTLTDPELKSADGCVDGHKTIDEDVTRELNRRIWVRPFPDENVARDTMGGKLKWEYWIDSEDLRKYQLSVLQRILGRR